VYDKALSGKRYFFGTVGVLWKMALLDVNEILVLVHVVSVD